MRLRLLLATACLGAPVFAAEAGAGRAGDGYFPPSDADGGWRSPRDATEARRVAACDPAALEAAFDVVQRTSKNAGLLVVRGGWLVFERYVGRAHREATANLASVGKSFTSVAVGILVHERPEIFPEGLDTRIFTPRHFPAEAFPLADPRMAEIKLGQLLAMTAGIRGNNPGSMVRGAPVTLDPAGPDGSSAMIDAVAFGRRPTASGNRELRATPLWCEPGGGYSYASASPHLASIVLRHVSGRELEEHIRERIAGPLGWGAWSWGYRQGAAQRSGHTPGAGGIVVRPTDMLRFGYLLLREGRWRDRQIIPADYVRHCAAPSPYNPHSGYSLQFDVNGRGQWPDVPRDAYWKGGSGGNTLYVIPSLDLVVWRLGGRDGQYAPADTGLPVHPDAARAADDRPNWKRDPAFNDEKAAHEILRRVVAAIRD